MASSKPRVLASDKRVAGAHTRTFEEEEEDGLLSHLGYFASTCVANSKPTSTLGLEKQLSDEREYYQDRLARARHHNVYNATRNSPELRSEYQDRLARARQHKDSRIQAMEEQVEDELLSNLGYFPSARQLLSSWRASESAQRASGRDEAPRPEGRTSESTTAIPELMPPTQDATTNSPTPVNRRASFQRGGRTLAATSSSEAAPPEENRSLNRRASFQRGGRTPAATSSSEAAPSEENRSLNRRASFQRGGRTPAPAPSPKPAVPSAKTAPTEPDTLQSQSRLADGGRSLSSSRASSTELSASYPEAELCISDGVSRARSFERAVQEDPMSHIGVLPTADQLLASWRASTTEQRAAACDQSAGISEEEQDGLLVVTELEYEHVPSIAQLIANWRAEVERRAWKSEPRASTREKSFPSVQQLLSTWRAREHKRVLSTEPQALRRDQTATSVNASRARAAEQELEEEGGLLTQHFPSVAQLLSTWRSRDR